MQKYDPLNQEKEILKFWEDSRIYRKAKETNKGKKKFYFCDGPPYTSGKVHLGTAWNKSLKDSILRYKRMQGFDAIDRAGYDMHGLPTENATEKELNLKTKDSIVKFGIGKFVKACKELSTRNMKLMNEDFIRLGVWMDFKNAYQSVTPEYIDGVWWLVRKAHESGRLYEGLRSMAWDWEHQTTLAKHELEYKDIEDNSIYLKMKVRGKDNEYLIVWTTTPWTVAFNLGIMANPKLDYAKCKVDSEQWILARDLIDEFSKVSGKKLKVVEELKGKNLEGLEYEHPFEELKQNYQEIKLNHPKTHTVVMTEQYVDTSSGTGLVHMAPGCGPEDYEVGHKNDIPAWNQVEENGCYGKNMGIFSKKHATKDSSFFIKVLKEKNAVVAEKKMYHSYPHGQRSKAPVIFRTTEQWFFKVEDMKEDIIKQNNEIEWVPKAGYNAFNAWLENLRDNSISKQRFWGTPVPIWRNTQDKKDYMVIGSIRELEKLSGKKVDEPHIPWIDRITIEKDGKNYQRVPDVLDVWVDAGTASWNSLEYPHKQDPLKKYFPADFILEGKDQIRGWFNLLHIVSMIAFGKKCFKASYMHGFINDAMGRKMSKSLGNYILPEEVIGKYGADTLRYYMVSGAAPGLDLNYNFEDMKVKYRNLTVLWNVHNYLIDLYKDIGINPKDMRLEKGFTTEENYIFSKLNSAIEDTTRLYDGYRLNEVPLVVEGLFLALSRVYIQLTRDKANDEHRKHYVMYTVFKVLMDALKLFAPVAPFITESIYQNLRKEFSLKEESIHLLSWPKCNDKLISKSLEKQMDTISEVVQSILSLREKIQLGQRWPLQEAVVVTNDERTIKAVERLKKIVKKQTNVKELDVQQSLPGIKLNIKADYSQIGPDFGNKAPQIIAKLSSESPEAILRQIERDGKFGLKIKNEKVNIVREHLIVTREVPKPYVEASFKMGHVYLNREIDQELETEGYARELMRRIQALRKKAGLQKQDRVSLFVRTGIDLVNDLKMNYHMIKEKVGAEHMTISELNPNKKHKFTSVEKVRGKKFELFLEKV